MTSTPDRFNTSKGRIQSPRTPLSPSTVGASRVADCIRKYVDLHKKWQLTVQKGTQYCTAIENIKKGVLESKQDEPNPYPDNLQLYCKNLAILNTILEDVVSSLGEMIQQLEVLQVALKGDTVGRSWSIRRTLGALHKLFDYFQSELKTRQLIAEHIGHALSLSELAIHVALWEQLSDHNEEVRLLTRMLSIEFDVTIS